MPWLLLLRFLHLRHLTRTLDSVYLLAPPGRLLGLPLILGHSAMNTLSLPLKVHQAIHFYHFPHQLQSHLHPIPYGLRGLHKSQNLSLSLPLPPEKSGPIRSCGPWLHENHPFRLAWQINGVSGALASSARRLQTVNKATLATPKHAAGSFLPAVWGLPRRTSTPRPTRKPLCAVVSPQHMSYVLRALGWIQLRE